MITPADEGRDHEPDDPLALVLRPPSDHLAPPPGRYETIRRTAARRRLLRAGAAVGASCAVAALIVLPLRLSAQVAPAPPAVPLAPPPPPSREPAAPVPSASPRPAEKGPTTDDRPTDPSRTSGPGSPAEPAGRARTPSDAVARASDEPSAEQRAAESGAGRDTMPEPRTTQPRPDAPPGLEPSARP
ncbi:hypothetical protein [Streptomyces sp. NPDC095613]|uniref:hypothetical protein n=1 Tax=Streptomyces sp. NPDC095613 TaxID=3155540 RepID=UPI0033188647